MAFTEIDKKTSSNVKLSSKYNLLKRDFEALKEDIKKKQEEIADLTNELLFFKQIANEAKETIPFYIDIINHIIKRSRDE